MSVCACERDTDPYKSRTATLRPYRLALGSGRYGDQYNIMFIRVRNDKLRTQTHRHTHPHTPTRTHRSAIHVATHGLGNICRQCVRMCVLGLSGGVGCVAGTGIQFSPLNVMYHNVPVYIIGNERIK